MDHAGPCPIREERLEALPFNIGYIPMPVFMENAEDAFRYVQKNNILVIQDCAGSDTALYTGAIFAWLKENG